jgi:hypothetical protein
MKKITFTFIITLLFIGSCLTVAYAQDSQLTLSFSRDFGYAGGGEIQGLFSFRVSGPDDLARVEFYIDDQKLGEDVQSPFTFQFSTDNYAIGDHTLYAVGYTTGGKELRSNQSHRTFVSAEDSWKAAAGILGPVLGLVIAVSLVSILGPILLDRGKKTPLGATRNYGMVGGAICPKCGRPFAMHFLKLNLLVGALERCPHCGKFSVVRHASMAELRAAEAAELEGSQPQVSSMSEEEKLKKELESSKYQDI